MAKKKSKTATAGTAQETGTLEAGRTNVVTRPLLDRLMEARIGESRFVDGRRFVTMEIEADNDPRAEIAVALDPHGMNG